ncbi:hypothetical protein UFOVP148_20 [uncultured Caudovirales phage]|uniref:Uncharacterized protein n=1 Tax=uncultured Caudovirales phage TaxID=2100421 RepID=A0A6J7W8X6_9CAUD|nr:hypothetical protein UFOVP148_20 [uncultured Caudovirales phage]
MTQDEIIEMARQAGLHLVGTEHNQAYTEVIEAFAKLVAAKEQARCCSIVYGQCESDNVAERTVRAIRARSKS